MASAQDEGMDFHKAFLSIDTDHSGEITVDELQSYCRKMNYQETFVQKWLMLFDADQNGRITYDEYCNALGLPPKKDVIAKHKSQQSKGKKSGKTARAVKVAKRRKEQEETRVTVETVKPPVQEEVVQLQLPPWPPPKAAAAGQAPQPPPSQAPSRRSRIRNEQLSYSGSARVFQRKALYRLAKKSAANKLARKLKGAPSTAAQKRPATVEKPIGGDKNGGTRQVASRRQPRSLPPSLLEAAPSPSSQDLRAAAAPSQSLHPAGQRADPAGRPAPGKRVVFPETAGQRTAAGHGAIQGQWLPAETRLPELRDRHQDSAGAGGTCGCRSGSTMPILEGPEAQSKAVRPVQQLQDPFTRPEARSNQPAPASTPQERRREGPESVDSQ
uniref:EF-hand domain-containing protein n=1 Tax=Macrostomum lignano TaxID=282301 RepID=A0A1I8FHH7_9PLAT